MEEEWKKSGRRLKEEWKKSGREMKKESILKVDQSLHLLLKVELGEEDVFVREESMEKERFIR